MYYTTSWLPRINSEFSTDTYGLEIRSCTHIFILAFYRDTFSNFLIKLKFQPSCLTTQILPVTTSNPLINFYFGEFRRYTVLDRQQTGSNFIRARLILSQNKPLPSIYIHSVQIINKVQSHDTNIIVPICTSFMEYYNVLFSQLNTTNQGRPLILYITHIMVPLLAYPATLHTTHTHIHIFPWIECRWWSHQGVKPVRQTPANKSLHHTMPRWAITHTHRRVSPQYTSTYTHSEKCYSHLLWLVSRHSL